MSILQQPQHKYWKADFLFLGLAMLYAWLAFKGVCVISANGAILDSDLQTYAQAMAAEACPEYFLSDPMLAKTGAGNSISNLQSILAAVMLRDNNFGTALLKAGAVAIFIFYSSWYLFGRMLFGRPVLAAICSILMGITVWTGWGTFWGITHADPVPRVFFAAIFPILLCGAVLAVKRQWLQTPVLLATGCCMWVHGINALNCGAMFFTAFLFLKAPDRSWGRHLCFAGLNLILFFIPVLIFLWPALLQSKNFDADDLVIFNSLFQLRWQKDYSSFYSGIIYFLSPANAPFYVLLGGCMSWFAVAGKVKDKMRTFWRMCPWFLLALILVASFCWLESAYAARLGRLNMGHELIRGLRFLIPLSWILISCSIALFMPQKLWVPALCLVLVLIGIFNADRQYIAAQYAIWEYTGLKLPHVDNALALKKEADNYRDMLEWLKRQTGPNESIYSSGEDMAIRFVSMRPLVHTFKDGFGFFYNKDLDASKNWLAYEKIRHGGESGLAKAWMLSKAPWLLIKSDDNHAGLDRAGKLAGEKNGWQLYHILGSDAAVNSMDSPN